MVREEKKTRPCLILAAGMIVMKYIVVIEYFAFPADCEEFLPSVKLRGISSNLIGNRARLFNEGLHCTVVSDKKTH